MALTVAVECRLIQNNPSAIRVKLAKVEKRKVEPMSVEERQALIKAVEGDRLSALFSVLLFAGLRKGEALGLHWHDVDLEGRKLRVRLQLQRINKALVLTVPKTEKSQRELTIDERAVMALREHRTRQLEERMAAGPVWEDTGLVFTTVVGSPVDPRNASECSTGFSKRRSCPTRGCMI